MSLETALTVVLVLVLIVGAFGGGLKAGREQSADSVCRVDSVSQGQHLPDGSWTSSQSATYTGNCVIYGE